MPKKKPIKVELVQEGNARVIVSTFTGGEVVRVPVEVKKATRRPFRPHKKLGMTGAAVLNVQKRVEAQLDNVQTVVRDYCNAWAEPDPEKRVELLKRSWSDHGVYQDPRSDVSGREALHEHIGAFFQRMPGSKIVLTSGTDEHHGKIHFTWKAVAADGSTLTEGRDFGELDDDGRLKRIVGFFGPPPAL